MPHHRCASICLLALIGCASSGTQPAAPEPPAGGSGGGPTGGAGGSPPAADAAPPPPPAPSPTPAADAAMVEAGGAPPPAGASILDDPPPGCRREVPVAGSAALGPALAAATPGDCLLLADGDYAFPVVSKQGTAEAPIVIRAEHRGKAAVPAGDIALAGSTYVALDGLLFTSGGSIDIKDSPYCRLTRTRILPAKDKGGAWVNMQGKTHHVRIDHNDMGNKTVPGNMVQTGVDVPGQVVQYIRIDHNLFHDVHFGGGNGWETIRAGYSHVAPSKGFITIEYNLFRAANGDPETISVKSSDDIVRYNTMRGTNGQICLRHGNRTQVYGNFILGSGSGGAGTIRIYGADHKIYNNYIAGNGPINLAAGDADGTDVPGTAHYRVYRNEVVNNTIIGSGVIVGGGALAPVGCTIANNLTMGGNIGTGGQGTKAMNNVTDGAGMVQTAGLWKLTAGSKAIDASLPGFDYVMDDIDGQKRQGKPDLGADELSMDPVTRGPLTEADVGPDAP